MRMKHVNYSVFWKSKTTAAHEFTHCLNLWMWKNVSGIKRSHLFVCNLWHGQKRGLVQAVISLRCFDHRGCREKWYTTCAHGLWYAGNHRAEILSQAVVLLECFGMMFCIVVICYTQLCTLHVNIDQLHAAASRHQQVFMLWRTLSFDANVIRADQLWSSFIL